MARIMVVEDDPAVREMLRDCLTGAGHAVDEAADAAALDARLADGPAADLFLLDVGLPGEDGFRLARRLRERLDPGIVMLTGAADLVDRVVGLEVGADDYLAKPFAPAELRARIDAVLRRRRPQPPEPDMLPFGDWRLDLRAYVLRDADGAEMPLGPTEIDLVAAFATNAGRVLTRDDLLRLAPPRDEDSMARSIDHRVARLRQKIERNPDRPAVIKTVRGVGYLLPRQDGGPG